MPDLKLDILMSDLTLLKSHVKCSSCSPSSNLSDRNSLLMLSLQLKLKAFSVACARIACLFPHSMHVERLVSSHI